MNGSRRLKVEISVLFIGLALLSACSGETPVAAPSEASQMITTLETTETLGPTDAEPSAAISTQEEVKPTISPIEPEQPTAILPQGDPISHLQSGSELVIERIWMMDETQGWAVGGASGDLAHVLITSDGGANWQDVTPPEPAPGDLQAVEVVAAFQNSTTGWVTFQRAPSVEGFTAPVVWHTENRGEAWTAGEPLDVSGYMGFYGPSRIGFSDDQHGWLMLDLDSAMMHRYIAIYTTGDAGQTWDRVVDPASEAPIQLCDKTGMTMDASGTGLLSRDCHGLIEGVFVEATHDGGTTWESLALEIPFSTFEEEFLCSVHSPVIFSTLEWGVGVTCVAFNEGADEGDEIWLQGPAYLFRTVDGGNSWERMDAPGGNLVYLTEELILSLSRDLHRTEDGGHTWQYLKAVSWDASFSFISADVGWAAAYAGEERALVRTNDGGLSWFELNPQIP